MYKKEVPDYILERFLLGELSQTDLRDINNRLKKDPKLQRRLDKLKKSNSEILHKYTPDDIAVKLETKLKAIQIVDSARRKPEIRPSFYRNMRFAGVGFILVILAMIPIMKTIENHQTEYISLKGDDLKLYLYKKDQSKVVVLKNNDKVKEGDLIQISYFTKNETYGMIFSLDGRGEITLHFPLSGDTFKRMDSGKKIFLSSSYQLDDAPRFEHFYVVTSRNAENIHKILSKIKIQKNKLMSEEVLLPDLGSDIEISSFYLKK